MTIGVLELERVAARGWQAEHEAWVGDWWLRANDGFTGRANSVLPLGEPGRDLDDAIAEVVDWYATWGLPARFAVPAPTGQELDTALRDRGWTPAWGARVMVAAMGDLPGTRPQLPEVHVRPAPSDAWLDAYHYRGGTLPDAGRDLLRRAEVVGFAEVWDDRQLVAIGRGTVVEGWLGITAVEVPPAHRRRGLATHLLAGLARWGADRGAERAYLQVELGNDAATALYEGAGFVEHHTYRYLDAPA